MDVPEIRDLALQGVEAGDHLLPDSLTLLRRELRAEIPGDDVMDHGETSFKSLVVPLL